MSGRKTQAQTLIELIDRRIKSALGRFDSSTRVSTGTNRGISGTNPKTAFEDVSFITRDDHRGGGHGDLPNSSPAYDLNCDFIPDADCSRNIGSIIRAWRIIFAQILYLKGKSGWLKLDVDYFYNHIAFKAHGNKVFLHGYGNHRIKDRDGKLVYPNTISIQIARPLPYTSDAGYTSIKSWRVDAWYSRVDIDNETGAGSRRSCAAEASPSNPCVEAEIVDTGNPDCVYVRFRNYLPYPVVVGVAVSY